MALGPSEGGATASRQGSTDYDHELPFEDDLFFCCGSAFRRTGARPPSRRLGALDRTSNRALLRARGNAWRRRCSGGRLYCGSATSSAAEARAAPLLGAELQHGRAWVHSWRVKRIWVTPLFESPRNVADPCSSGAACPRLKGSFPPRSRPNPVARADRSRVVASPPLDTFRCASTVRLPRRLRFAFFPVDRCAGANRIKTCSENCPDADDQPAHQPRPRGCPC